MSKSDYGRFDPQRWQDTWQESIYSQKKKGNNITPNSITRCSIKNKKGDMMECKTFPYV